MEIPTNVFHDAVVHFWTTRDKQTGNQQNKGTIAQGFRGAVTGGKQMDGFLITIANLMTEKGVPEDHIYLSRRRERYIPGFFRPTKEWDLLVISENQLLAAVELKSQVGSFGNNFNNRTEEAIGTAYDLWTAYREGAFDGSLAPWLGYLFLLEDCEASQKPVKVNEPHFKVFSEFKGASYAQRYELFCRKLVRERKYSSTCLLLSKKTTALEPQNYIEPANDMSATTFLSNLLRHVSSFYGY